MYWTQSPTGPQSIQYAHSSKKNKDKTRATPEPLKTQKQPADIGRGIMCTGKKNKNENILLNLELANIRENAAPAEDSTLILNGGFYLQANLPSFRYRIHLSEWNYNNIFVSCSRIAFVAKDLTAAISKGMIFKDKEHDKTMSLIG